MSNPIEQFLEIKGAKIKILYIDNLWYIVMRPVLEAFNVDPKWFIKVANDDPILKDHIKKLPVKATDEKLREMYCIDSDYVYGWLFTITSDVPELIEFKRECYSVLKNHFKKAMELRLNELAQQKQNILERQLLINKLKNSEDYKRLQEIEASMKKGNRRLKMLDDEIIQSQLSIPI